MAPSINLDDLQRSLELASEHVHALDLGGGTRGLVLLRGARMLGLAAADGRNRLWSNPALRSPSSAQAFYVREHTWFNSGGDRTWISPEFATFVADPQHIAESYRVPATIDPGTWTARPNSNGCELRTECVVRLYRPDLEVPIRLTKTWSSLIDPLGAIGGDDLSRPYRFAGYRQTTLLEVREGGLEATSGVPPRVIDIWNLLQLPHDGVLVIPTYARAEPQTVFGTIPSGDLLSSERAIRYRMRAPGAQKITVAATRLCGRAGYCYRSSPEELTLIVRSFVVDPSAVYADPLWDQPQGQRFCVQACNSHNGSENFSELEYHAQAIPVYAGARCVDVSQVWSYCGPDAAIRSAMRSLLGCG